MQSQQLSLHSQYMFNDFILNPAIAGTTHDTPLHFSFRRQWVGIEEAPVTQFLSGNGYLGYNLGFGAVLFNEASGPTRRTGVSVSTAYHLILKKMSQEDQHVISFGLSGLLTQHYLDKEKLITYFPDDPTIAAAYNSQMVPDASFGVYYHNMDNYFAGISVINLFQTKSDLYNIPNDIKNNFVRNYYVYGGGKLEMNNKFAIQPSFLLQGIESLPVQIDLNARFIYLKKYWLGVSYRHQDAIVAMFGIKYNEYAFGYSYDATLSDLRNFSSGSHELTLTLLLNKFGANFYKTDPGNYRMKKGRFKPVRSF